MSESIGNPSKFLQLSQKYIAPLEAQNGTLEFEGTMAAESADDVLRNIKGYIGVTPVGSIVRGYKSPSSDIDLIVFVDSAAYEELDAVSQPESFADMAERKIKEVFKTNRKIHVVPAPLDDVAIQETVDILSDNVVRDFWFQIFNPMAIGQKIEEYRRKISINIKKRPFEEQSHIIERFAEALVMGEEQREPKIIENIPGIDSGELLDMFAARRQLWTDHITEVIQIHGKI